METVNIPVGLDQTEEIVCEECGGNSFVPTFLLRKISALLSPTGKETIMPIQVFACSSCNHINEDLLPIEKS